MKKFLWFALLVFIDQVTKYVFYDLQWLDSWWLMTPLLNTWIAWSLPVPQWLIITLSLVLIVGVFWFLSSSSWKTFCDKNRDCIHYHLMAIILFVSGATGNLLDRFLYGGVRDFIDFHVWPVFNLADTFLTLAVIVMLWVEFLWFRNQMRKSAKK